MAYPIHGKVCELTVDGATANQVANLTEWSINATLDTSESTAFQDNWKTFVAGVAGATGSASGHFDPSDTYQKEILDLLVAAAPTGALADGRWQLKDAGDYFSGAVLITGIEIGAGIGDTVKVTINYLFNGALTCTIA